MQVRSTGKHSLSLGSTPKLRRRSHRSSPPSPSCPVDGTMPGKEELGKKSIRLTFNVFPNICSPLEYLPNFKTRITRRTRRIRITKNAPYNMYVTLFSFGFLYLQIPQLFRRDPKNQKHHLDDKRQDCKQINDVEQLSERPSSFRTDEHLETVFHCEPHNAQVLDVPQNRHWLHFDKFWSGKQ